MLRQRHRARQTARASISPRPGVSCVVAGRQGLVLLLSTLLLNLMIGSDALAYQRPGLTERISVASDGTQGNAASGVRGMSADGRYIAFGSNASNLVEGDTNGAQDVFIRDRHFDSTERVSISNDGSQGNGSSLLSGMTADGRYVLFTSAASNLVPDDTNGVSDSFVRDLVEEVTERVSVASDGSQGNGHDSAIGSISANGRYVAFASAATNLVAGDTNGKNDVFLRDRLLGTTERISVSSAEVPGDGHSGKPHVSADGRIVVFNSFSKNLAGNPTPWPELFVRDRSAGTTQRVAVSSEGVEGNNTNLESALSHDGRFVAFASEASNLVPGDTNGEYDVFVRDLVAGVTERVSISSDGKQAQMATGGSWPSISADGRFVAFSSPFDFEKGSGFSPALYLRDRVGGTTERISVNAQGTPGDAYEAGPWISSNGRIVAWSSLSRNLVPFDTNGEQDVFVRDRGGELAVSPQIRTTRLSQGIAVEGTATFSPLILAAKTDQPEATPSLAAAPWTDILSAEIVHRPEAEAVLFRMRLRAAPPAGTGLAPGLVYGLSFRMSEGRYEVRATPTDAGASSSGRFGLFRCDPLCAEVAQVQGTFWQTGPEVLISIPYDSIPLYGLRDTWFDQSRAFAAPGDTLFRPVQPSDDPAIPTRGYIDELALGNVFIEPPVVQAALLPAQSQELAQYQEGVFPSSGAFTFHFPTSGGGERRLFLRACISEDVCGPATSLLVEA